MQTLTRREFIKTTGIAAAAGLTFGMAPQAHAASALSGCPVTVFSKVYQELKLGFEDAARLTAEAGLDGIDCPVRAGGEIVPEKAKDEMPRYAEALRGHNARMLLLTTGILGVDSPNAEDILRTAKKLGVRYYRLGSVTRNKDAALGKAELTEIQAKLKDLAAMNREIGVTALAQNHSPSGRSAYLGGDLVELAELMAPFKPEEIGVAFDIGHALIVHKDQWTAHFEKLKSHLQIAYVKDPGPENGFVPFGAGRVQQTDFFKRLKALNYSAPVSMHIEFDWSNKRAALTRDALLKALKASTEVVRNWLATA